MTRVELKIRVAAPVAGGAARATVPAPEGREPPPIDPDLSLVIGEWSFLPEQTRREILAILSSAERTGSEIQDPRECPAP